MVDLLLQTARHSFECWLRILQLPMSTPGLPILSVCMVSKVKQLEYVLVSNIDETFETDSMLAKFSCQSDCR